MSEQAYFKTRFSFDKKRDLVWRYVSAYIQKYIPQEAKVLDIGAGYGNFINNIKAAEKHALDSAEITKNYLDENVIFHLSPVSEMKRVQSAYFDIVFASNILEHLSPEELRAALLQVRRVLKPAGKIIILQPNFKYSYKVYFDDHTHRQIFTDKGLSDLLRENGFRVAKVIPRFLPFSMKSSFPKIGFLIRLYLRSRFKPFAGQMLVIAERTNEK